MKTLIYGGRVIDPANHVDGKLNLLIEDGRIAWAGTGLPVADRTIDATGKIVTPGFIDIHMHEDPVADGKLQQDIFLMMLRMGVTTATGGKTVEVPLDKNLPLPIDQFVTGNILPGYGMAEAKALTKLMEMAYAGK